MRKRDFPKDRPLPPNYKFLVTQEFYRVPTWKERLLILLGYRLRITLKMATLHHCGRFTSAMDLVTTKELDPKTTPHKDLT